MDAGTSNVEWNDPDGDNTMDQRAFYVDVTYTAASSSATITLKTLDDNNGPHLSAVTQQVMAAAPPALKVTAVTRTPLGAIVIDFTGAPSTTYNVTKSPDLVVPFGPLTIPLTAGTDGAGVGQAIVPATEASEPKEFYRIETQP